MSSGNPFTSNVPSLGHNGFEVSMSYISGVPDTNLVSDPQLKVIFKGLAKTNGRTKEKALTELAAFVSDPTNTALVSDDLVLMTWVQLYPKLAVDLSKGVRSGAHGVQSRLVSTLGKGYAKYLKDTVPVWLAATFDGDRVGARDAVESLSAAVGKAGSRAAPTKGTPTTEGNSRQKSEGNSVIDRLYPTLQAPVLNYILQVVQWETKDTLSDERYTSEDESVAKFSRVAVAAVGMLAKLLAIPSLAVDITPVLRVERLWEEFLGGNDLALKRSSYLMISSLAQSNHLADPKITKLVGKHLLKSLKIKATRETAMGYAPVVLPAFTALIHMSKLHPAFWGASKRAPERLLDLVTLGSCGSDPSYYDYLFTLLVLAPVSVLDFSSATAGAAYLSLAQAAYGAEALAAFKEKAWIYANNLFLRFWRAGSVSEEVMEEMWVQTLPVASAATVGKLATTLVAVGAESDSGAEAAVVAVLHRLVEACLPDRESITHTGAPLYSAALCPAYFQLLVAMKLERLGALLAAVEESLATFEEDQRPVVTVALARCFVESLLEGLGAQICELVSSVPLLLAPDFFDEPMELLVAFSPSRPFFNEPILVQALNDAFLKLVMLESPAVLDRFLAVLPRIAAHLTAFESECPEIAEYLCRTAKAFDFEGLSSNAVQILTKELAVALFDQAREGLNEAQFVAQISQPEHVAWVATQRPAFLAYLWETYTNPVSANLMALVEAQVDSPTVDAYVASVHALASKGPAPAVAAHLASTQRLAQILPAAELAGALARAMAARPDVRLALGNPLEGNVYVVDADNKSAHFDLDLANEAARWARFILGISAFVDLAGIMPVEDYAAFMVNIGLAGEVAADAAFLGEHKSEAVDPLVDTLAVSSACRAALAGMGFTLVTLAGGEGSIVETTMLAQLSSPDLSPRSFYHARVLQRLVAALCESESAASVTALAVNFTALTKTPLKLAAFALGMKPFLTLPQFDRPRNAVAAELVGLPVSKILSTGLQSLTLLNTFMAVENREGFVALPPQRLNMILNTFTGWLESEIAYDPEFGPIRSQLCAFFTLLMGGASDSRTWAMAMAVCRDALSVAEIDTQYFALRLFLALQKHSATSDAWDEEKDSLYEEAVEVAFASQRLGLTQPAAMCQAILTRILGQLPVSTGRAHYAQFLTLLEASDSMELQRVATQSLAQTILLQQQEFVIEYELQSASITEGTPEAGLQAVLPLELLRLIAALPEEYVEHATGRFSRYVWGWYLVFLHFENITYRIRKQYVSALKAKNAIVELLDFIFLQVDLQDTAFVLSLTPEAVQMYSVTETTSDEFRHLLVHLCLLVFRYCGAQAQSWFLNIRDRQLKSRVEKFCAKYVSATIVASELSKAEALLKNSDKKFADANLTIKVNRNTNEIKSVYLIDEQTMEMVIRIPQAFPLVNVVVEGPQRLGVKENQWKAWLLASQLVITSQNGTILEAIELFNRNVSYHFSGFEECAICYSILHQDHSLPTRNCLTCSNKFHSACLYKWFKSSGSSTCPLCRSTFNFRIHK